MQFQPTLLLPTQKLRNSSSVRLARYHDVPVHREEEDYLDAYIEAAAIRNQAKQPLFRTIDSRRQLTHRRMHRNDVLRMMKRRAKQAGIQSRVCVTQ